MTRLLRRLRPPNSQAVLWVVIAVVAVTAFAVISAHVASASGTGNPNNSTTPVGSDPSASWMAPLAPRSDETKPVVTLFWLVGIESIVIFVLVCAALFVNIARFSHHPGDDSEPKQVYGNQRIEIAWTLIPAVILLVGFIATVVVLVQIDDPSAQAAANALQVDVTGHQWFWQFSIPEYHVETANAIHVPDNRMVEFNITSRDVIHSFWVPQLVVQVDATPNNMTHLFLDHPSLGVYPGACYEFCGQGHAWMQFRMYVDTPAEFQHWARHQSKPVNRRLSPLALQGEQVFTSHSCGACHTIKGISTATGTAAPNLTHVGSRWGIAGGVLPMSLVNLERWVNDPNQWKEGAKMPPFNFLTPHQLKAVATFLYEAK